MKNQKHALLHTNIDIQSDGVAYPSLEQTVNNSALNELEKELLLELIKIIKEDPDYPEWRLLRIFYCQNSDEFTEKIIKPYLQSGKTIPFLFHTLLFNCFEVRSCDVTQYIKVFVSDKFKGQPVSLIVATHEAPYWSWKFRTLEEKLGSGFWLKKDFWSDPLVIQELRNFNLRSPLLDLCLEILTSGQCSSAYDLLQKGDWQKEDLKESSFVFVKRLYDALVDLGHVKIADDLVISLFENLETIQNNLRCSNNSERDLDTAELPVIYYFPDYPHISWGMKAIDHPSDEIVIKSDIALDQRNPEPVLNWTSFGLDFLKDFLPLSYKENAQEFIIKRFEKLIELNVTNSEIRDFINNELIPVYIKPSLSNLRAYEAKLNDYPHSSSLNEQLKFILELFNPYFLGKTNKGLQLLQQLKHYFFKSNFIDFYLLLCSVFEKGNDVLAFQNLYTDFCDDPQSFNKELERYAGDNDFLNNPIYKMTMGLFLGNSISLKYFESLLCCPIESDTLKQNFPDKFFEKTLSNTGPFKYGINTTLAFSLAQAWLTKVTQEDYTRGKRLLDFLSARLNFLFEICTKELDGVLHGGYLSYLEGLKGCYLKTALNSASVDLDCVDVCLELLKEVSPYTHSRRIPGIIQIVMKVLTLGEVSSIEQKLCVTEFIQPYQLKDNEKLAEAVLAFLRFYHKKLSLDQKLSVLLLFSELDASEVIVNKQLQSELSHLMLQLRKESIGDLGSAQQKKLICLFKLLNKCPVKFFIKQLLTCFRSLTEVSVNKDLSSERISQVVNCENWSQFVQQGLFDALCKGRNITALEEVRQAICEFATGKLKLKKGVRVGSKEYYLDSQCSEPNSDWRACYVKILEELELDLDSKVHKSLFFVRKHDPDSEVRDFAHLAYRAVRKESLEEDNVYHIEKRLSRSIKAAMWCLFYFHRFTLTAGDVDPVGANRLRRKLLR